MPYNVLNTEGEKIVVNKINPQIHKHLSGREFTDNDECVKCATKEQEEETITLQKEGGELTLAGAKIAYKEKYGVSPKGNPKLETILAKL